MPFAGDTTVATLRARIDRLMPVSADLGPLAAVFEKAGRPNPHERSSAAEFGRALVQAAEKLPKPAPAARSSTGGPSLFDAPPGQETTSELTRFRDSTGAIGTRPDRPHAASPGPARRSADPSGGTPRPRVVTVDEQGDETGELVAPAPRPGVRLSRARRRARWPPRAWRSSPTPNSPRRATTSPASSGSTRARPGTRSPTTGGTIVVRSEPTETQPQGNVLPHRPSLGGVAPRRGDVRAVRVGRTAPRRPFPMSPARPSTRPRRR